jgi:hypothetical protein
MVFENVNMIFCGSLQFPKSHTDRRVCGNSKCRCQHRRAIDCDAYSIFTGKLNLSASHMHNLTYNVYNQ